MQEEKKTEKRKDSRGRVLRTGESQRPDGSYQFRAVVTDHAGNPVARRRPFIGTCRPPSPCRRGSRGAGARRAAPPARTSPRPGQALTCRR